MQISHQDRRGGEGGGVGLMRGGVSEPKHVIIFINPIKSRGDYCDPLRGGGLNWPDTRGRGVNCLPAQMEEEGKFMPSWSLQQRQKH